MRLLFAFIFLWMGMYVHAQSSHTSLLFKKGTELTYRNYATSGIPFAKNDYFETTRFLFIVRDVKDSNAVQYSYVTKIGSHPTDEGLRYEKNYVLMCDGNKIAIPIDFYYIDTIYFSNIYPGVKDRGIYSSVSYNGKCSYIFPLDFEKTKFETTCNQVSMDITTRAYRMNFAWQNNSNGTRSQVPAESGQITKNTFSTGMEIKKSETAGIKSITTPAGNYTCFETILTSHVEMLGKNVNNIQTLFYHPEVGLVKFESQQSKRKVSYTELVKVRKSE